MLQKRSCDTPVAEFCKAKFFATKALEFCASEAIQVLGGVGYLRGHPVERIYREVKVMAIGGGSEEIMRYDRWAYKTVSLPTLDHIRGHRL